MKSLFILALFFVVVFSSCKKKKSTTTCTPPDTVSFSGHIQPIFNAYCTSCHGGASPSANLNLDASVAYQNLMNPQKGYIDTINPSASLLYCSMNATTNPMPKSGKLDQCTVDLVLKWIQQKAKHN